MLKPGDRVPPFTLMASNGAEVSNESLAGQRYVLYSYPKDDTPGCTKEACSFRDNLPRFMNLGVAVYGLSADDEKSHIRFGRKYSLTFPLLADPERRLIEPLGVWVEKSMYGKTYMGVARSTFIVGPKGVIEHVWEKVNPEGHADEVLAWLAGSGLVKPKAPAAQPAVPTTSAIEAKPAAAVPSKAKAAAAKKPIKTAQRTGKAKAAANKPAPKAATTKSPAKRKLTGKAKSAAKGKAKPVAKGRAAAKAKSGAKAKAPVRTKAKSAAKRKPAKAAKGRR